MGSNKKRVTNQLEANMTESDDTLLKNLLSEIEQLGIVELRKYFKDLLLLAKNSAQFHLAQSVG